MKTVLCFGDSNTWGWDPANQERYAPDLRWPGVLRQKLGAGHTIIEEGLNGRTTVWNDPIEGYKNGKEYLIPCLETHRPLDLVVIMLGTNDLKMRFSLPAYDIASGVGVLVDIVKRSECGHRGKAPKVLLIAPPPLGRLAEFADMFEGGIAKSLRLSEQYSRVAAELDCPLFDAGEAIVSSNIDGVHLEVEEHRKLGETVAILIKDLLEA